VGNQGNAKRKIALHWPLDGSQPLLTTSSTYRAISGQRRVIEAAPNSAPSAGRRHMSRRIHAKLQVGDSLSMTL